MSRQTPFIACICITAIAVCIVMPSCRKADSSAEMVDKWVGREFLFPESCTFSVSDNLFDINVFDADFKIITYIDSNGCQACNMKLQAWQHAIDSFKSIAGKDVEFLMIINSEETNDLSHIITQYAFTYPVVFDSSDVFNRLNNFSDNVNYQSFLLDSENKIIAIGNPVLNQSIYKLYHKIISGSDTLDYPRYINIVPSTRSLGALSPGDSVSVVFTAQNTCDSTLYVESATRSCPCIYNYTVLDSIAPLSSAEIIVHYTADSITGPFNRSLNIFFKGKDHPATLYVNGYVNKH